MPLISSTIAIITPNKTKPHGSCAAEDALDDVGHERRFRRVELLHHAAVRPRLVGAVDAGIDEIHGLAGIVDEITLRRNRRRDRDGTSER